MFGVILLKVIYTIVYFTTIMFRVCIAIHTCIPVSSETQQIKRSHALVHQCAVSLLEVMMVVME